MVAWGRAFVASSSASLPFLGSRWSSGTMRGDRMPLLQRNPIHSSISIFFCISKWSLFFFLILKHFPPCSQTLLPAQSTPLFSGLRKGYYLHCTAPWSHFEENIRRYSCTKQPAFLCAITEEIFLYPSNLFFRLQTHLYLKNFPKKLHQVFMFSTVIQQKLLSVISHQNIILEIKMKIVFKTRRN